MMNKLATRCCGGGLRRIALLVVLTTAGFPVATNPIVLAADEVPQGESRWAEATKVLDRFRVTKLLDGRREPVELVDHPLVSFVDEVDWNNDGSIWLWGRTGRPSVVLQTWKDARDQNLGPRIYSFTSLSTGRIEAVGTTDAIRSFRWTPREAGIAFQAFPDGPPAATTEMLRLRQMKDLARRFRAHEVLDGQRIELRLLSRQVHRYSDAQSGILDGAAFVWSRGSDPEILMLIELVKEGSENPQWKYTFARFGSEELHAHLADQEVWSKPFSSRTSATTPYLIFHENLTRQP